MRLPLVSLAFHNERPLASGLMLDNGLALLAAYARFSGADPVIYDYASVSGVRRMAGLGKVGFIEGVVAELSAEIKAGARAVCFKLYANGFSDSIAIANRLRDVDSSVRLFAGGPQAGWFGRHIFDYANELFHRDVFDAIIEGEGDVSIGQIAAGALPEDVSGAWFRRKDGQLCRNVRREVKSLDALPYPVYSGAVYRGVEGKIQIPVIEDSRNCDWRKCSFCIHPRLSGQYRERSIESLVGEANHNLVEYGFGSFRLAGPDPTPAYVNALARSLPQGTFFSAFGRADGEGYDLSVLKSRLVGGLFIGVESADEEMLKRLNKSYHPAKYLAQGARLIEEFREAGLPTVCSLIVPGPKETQESMERTFNFVLNARPDFTPVLPMMPMPGTPLAKWGRDKGIVCSDSYEKKLLMYELDLHKRKDEWAKPPYSLEVDGVFVDNPFLVSARFAERLQKSGFVACSDEIVLMADRYFGGLPSGQDERRRVCLDFHVRLRSLIDSADVIGLQEVVSRINNRRDA